MPSLYDDKGECVFTEEELRQLYRGDPMTMWIGLGMAALTSAATAAVVWVVVAILG